MQQRPILFIGAIKDIAAHNQSKYLVLVGRDLSGLQLSLLSSKDRVDSFLKKHPDLFKGYPFKNSVAVVARINSIRTAYVLVYGELTEIKIGDGKLIDIVYAGDVQF